MVTIANIIVFFFSMAYNPWWVFANFKRVRHCCLSSMASTGLSIYIALGLWQYRVSIAGVVVLVVFSNRYFHTSLTMRPSGSLLTFPFFSLESNLYHPIVASTTKPYIFLSILLSKTLRRSSFVTVSVQAWQPDITTCLITVLLVLILVPLEVSLNFRRSCTA